MYEPCICTNCNCKISNLKAFKIVTKMISIVQLEFYSMINLLKYILDLSKFYKARFGFKY